MSLDHFVSILVIENLKLFHPKRKNLLKNLQKIISKKYNRKNTYYQNPKKAFKSNLSNKKKNTPSPSQTQFITCYKCHQVGHKANKCPLKEKIMKLEK